MCTKYPKHVKSNSGQPLQLLKTGERPNKMRDADQWAYQEFLEDEHNVRSHLITAPKQCGKLLLWVVHDHYFLRNASRQNLNIINI